MITPEQTKALDEGQAVPLQIDGKECVLLSKDTYDRVRSLLYDDSDTTHEELRMALARSSKGNGWEEPGMDDYDRYDELKP